MLYSSARFAPLGVMWMGLVGVAMSIAACGGSAASVETDVCSPACPDGYTCSDGHCLATDGDAEPTGDNDTATDSDTTATSDDGDGEADSDADSDTQAEDGDYEGQSEDYTQTTCAHDETSTVPILSASPLSLDYGSVTRGFTKNDVVLVCNSGGADLHITAVQFATGTSRDFYSSHDSVPIIVKPGYETPVYVTYFASDAQADSGTLELLSNDTAQSTVSIPLTSSIKAEPYLTAGADTLQFPGSTPIGTTVSKKVTLTNNGLASTVLTFRIASGSSDVFKVIGVYDGDTAVPISDTLMLAAGKSYDVEVSMTMPVTPPAADSLLVGWQNLDGDQTLTVALVVSDASVCAIPNAGPDQTVRPLDTVLLDGTASRDPNGQVEAYKWEFVEKPDASEQAVLMDSLDNSIEGLWTTESTPHFFAVQAGTYRIRLTLKDSDPDCTEATSDEVVINVVPDETIHIQLNWSKANNDYDLHLIRPGGHHSRDCGKMGNAGDCCWSNCATQMGTDTNCPARGCPGPSAAPDWGVVGSRNDDPTLDIDDKKGTGPENVNLSLPELGDYLVTVEHFKGTDSNTLTVKVFLFGSQKLVARYGPPFSDSSLPVGYHWNVCVLRVVADNDIRVITIPSDDPAVSYAQTEVSSDSVR